MKTTPLNFVSRFFPPAACWHLGTIFIQNVVVIYMVMSGLRFRGTACGRGEMFRQPYPCATAVSVRFSL